MKDLSLHLLDIAQNSVAAGASQLEIVLTETAAGTLTLSLSDNGRGMSPELLRRVTDPFTTTRTTRKVGLGLPLLRMAAEQTGGSLGVESILGVGTTVTVSLQTSHIDCPPLGDLAGSIALLIQGAPHMAVCYRRETPAGSFSFDTREVQEILGPQISLAAPEIALWIQDYIGELERSVTPALT